MGQRFFKEERLLNQEIKRILRQEYPLRKDFFSIWHEKNFTDQAKVGFVIPKSRVSQSVERNKIKRIGREYFRIHKQKFLGGNWIFGITPKKAKKVSKKQIWNYIEDFFSTTTK